MHLHEFCSLNRELLHRAEGRCAMHIHEFLAKELRRGAGIIARTDGGKRRRRGRCAGKAGRYVVKAQVQAGDRLAGGGISFAESPAEARIAAAAMLGRPLSPARPARAAKTCAGSMSRKPSRALTNLYVAVALDRAAGEIVAAR